MKASSHQIILSLFTPRLQISQPLRRPTPATPRFASCGFLNFTPALPGSFFAAAKRDGTTLSGTARFSRSVIDNPKPAARAVISSKKDFRSPSVSFASIKAVARSATFRRLADRSDLRGRRGAYPIQIGLLPPRTPFSAQSLRPFYGIQGGLALLPFGHLRFIQIESEFLRAHFDRPATNLCKILGYSNARR